MNNDSANPLFAREIHSVFEFALVPASNGQPRQSVKNRGEFESVEDAFAFALANARREAAALVTANATTEAQADPAVSIISTEWGYDVRREHHTVTRFWVHSRPLQN
jgi:hypothetical protein